MKKLLAILMVIVFSAAAAAQSGEFNEAKQLIGSKVPCDQLSESQLEEIGDYYMEQMHPGELHEIMDLRMGGEGSDSLRLAHTSMAKSFYCGDNTAMGSGMMGLMMGRTGMMGSGYGMMIGYGGASGMMNGYDGYGMMGTGYGFGLYNVFLVLLIVLAALAIVWLVKQIAAKPTNSEGKIIKRR